jgi:uncharacterized protein with GYD domain
MESANELVYVVDDDRRAHAADFCVEIAERGEIGLVVLQRVRFALTLATLGLFARTRKAA